LSQQVKALDEHTAEVTVRAVRPPLKDENRGKPSAADAPSGDDLKPNNYIQCDDPLIAAQAKEAVGGETDPWKQAVALETYVHRAMTVTDFSQAFATAAEAAHSGKGDCKAHAVYLAALARAEKIPARVAVGLVYMPGSQTFGGHMWTEVYVGGRWIGLDATLGKGGLGGGHLQIAHSTLAGVTAYNFVYPMLQVLNGLKIEVLDWE
jgi:transglutaminase-like putative cysteine protease